MNASVTGPLPFAEGPEEPARSKGAALSLSESTCRKRPFPAGKILGASSTRLPLPHLRDSKAAQHRALLLVVSLHALEDVTKKAYGFNHVRSLVQHDAFRTSAHRCVCDF